MALVLPDIARLFLPGLSVCLMHLMSILIKSWNVLDENRRGVPKEGLQDDFSQLGEHV